VTVDCTGGSGAGTPVAGLQAAVLCGGLGTRLRPLTDTVPKPMVDVNGVPFLEHLLRQLVSQGVGRIVLMTGYLGDQIRAHFGSGQDHRCDIVYSHGSETWSTGRRLLEAGVLLDSRFLLLYADNFALVDLRQVLELHLREEPSITLTLSPKAHGNIAVPGDGRVPRYQPDRSDDGLDHVEIGYMVVERDRVLAALGQIGGAPDVDYSEVIKVMVSSGEVAGFVIGGGYHSISDPERLELTRDYLNPKKILLVDRDGVINEQSPRGEYVDRWDKFRFVEDTVTALEALSRSGFRFVVITNQAGVARGLVDKQELDLIHRNMVQTLARRGVEVVAVYVSPHHWNENSIMRKPEPGMFFQASGDLRFRLDRVLYIGDDIRDCQAAANAGCGMVFLGEVGPGETMPDTRHPQHSFNSLAEAVPFIIDHYESERLR